MKKSTKGGLVAQKTGNGKTSPEDEVKIQAHAEKVKEFKAKRSPIGSHPEEKPKKKVNEKFAKVREGKMVKSLQLHDDFVQKHSDEIRTMFKKDSNRSKIAKKFEKELGGKKQADHMVFYSLNRLGLIQTKNDGELVKRHEALRKELKNGKTAS